MRPNAIAPAAPGEGTRALDDPLRNVHRLPVPSNGAAKVTRDEDGAINVRSEAPAPMAPPDELVPFPFGLEVSAARKLVRDGTLRAARIGRRFYAKRSDVVGLVDRLAQTRPANDERPQHAYAKAVRRARAK